MIRHELSDGSVKCEHLRPGDQPCSARRLLMDDLFSIRYQQFGVTAGDFGWILQISGGFAQPSGSPACCNTGYQQTGHKC